ncbi:uncharacterized protein F5891DRAFT_8880 [Suillus fuscotomentosus]|uniref:Uncharacterized protein n=1 Tax=Suillus fuscotomentosus TaxID=1912939 RepID=A0AAD4ELB1_9AGAM|nr:uncharacterized protein F5891DRAFT_8880 [Suillus fuscotomentosus]KAG1908305.1 hypothetical protein F5891DRAFT_8880 [Suillus fuscotomentosus]
MPGDTCWLDTCELLACFTPIGEPTSMPSIYTLASSVPTDLGGVLEPEDVDVDDLIDADVSAETFVWLDNDDLREDLDEPSTLQLGTSTTPTLDLADAPCTPYALTGHRKNMSTYAEGVSVSKTVFWLTSVRQNQLEAINATLWNRICMWDIRCKYIVCIQCMQLLSLILGSVSQCLRPSSSIRSDNTDKFIQNLAISKWLT